MPKSAGLSFVGRVSGFMTGFTLMRFRHSYQRELFLIVTVGMAVFFWTAVASFNPLDNSPLSISVPAVPPLNLAGTIGAFISAYAFFAVGMIAWLLPLPIVFSAILVVRKDSLAFAKARTLGWILFFCTASAGAAILRPYASLKGFDFPSGGILGTQISSVLLATLGQVGLYIVLATAALAAVLLVMREAVLSIVGGKIAQYSRTNYFANLDFRKLLRSSPKTKKDVESEAEEVEAESLEQPETKISTPSLFSKFTQKEPAIDDDLETGEEPEIDIELAADEEEEDDIVAVPNKTAYRPPATDPNYRPPPLALFQKSETQATTAASQRELESTATLLIKTFEDFGVKGQIIGFQPGPVVTVYEFQPDAGVKQSKIIGLIDDLALALKVDSIFIHPVRGKRALGVQVPNNKREAVFLGDILGAASFTESASPLTFGMGKTINGTPISADLAAMPHLLMAGATGSGKSVAVNAMLSSIIMKATPDEVRMILVDPKMLELSVYEGIPHLLMPVITEPTKASLALKWAASEMERRYRLMQLACVRNIGGFNEFWAKATPQRKKEIQETLEDDTITRLPYILLVIDELADLMMTAPKDVESSIQRLAQKARASGIHMVLATQRPSVDIITGVIKANLPCRVAFQVVSKHDSRTILDLIGAEKLLGKGDMLFQRPGSGRLERVQGALISDEEVINLVAAVKQNAKETYDENIISWIDEEYNRQKDGSEEGGPGYDEDDDPKWDEAINIGRTHGVVSASFLQRHLKIGYNRAARIVESMEAKGYVAKADGSKPRKWLGN
jgi:S-DNA-T family DNA segregation ATPase FtsK/SpoIIIE